MDIRKAIAAVLVAATAAIGSSGVAGARVYVDIEVAPPPARVEVVPAPRAGYVWAPGYWHWNGHRHAWHRGYWVRERRGYAWVPHRWHHEGERWRFDDGHWERRG